MTEGRFHLELQRNHNWNAKWNTIDACFWQIAFTCSIPSVIIVAFLKHFTRIIPSLLFTNLGGYLADAYSPVSMFVLVSSFSLIGLLILLYKYGPLWNNEHVMMMKHNHDRRGGPDIISRGGSHEGGCP